MPTAIYSFGFRHGHPNTTGKDLVIDVRGVFNRNPYHNRKLRQLRGDHPEVQKDIQRTPGFVESYEQLRREVSGYPGDVYLGCTGGHHRSVYLAERLGRELGVPVMHLNYDDK